MISVQDFKDVGFNGMGHTSTNTSLCSSMILTGQHRGEENVVREGDKAAFAQREKYAVLICKLLPLLGDLLLI